MPNASTEDIALRFFSSRAVELLLNQPENIRDEAFFRCWTRKEADIKARSEGMSIPLDQFKVSFLPGDPPEILRIKDDPQAAARWSLFHLEPGEGYTAALAVKGHPDQLNLFRWGEDQR
jgi:4'-phosphopantetheinyl transferase